MVSYAAPSKITRSTFFGEVLYGVGPVAPVAYQVILEPDIGQFRDFESPRVLTLINS